VAPWQQEVGAADSCWPGTAVLVPGQPGSRCLPLLRASWFPGAAQWVVADCLSPASVLLLLEGLQAHARMCLEPGCHQHVQAVNQLQLGMLACAVGGWL
jgi:hypothetical protein